MGTLRLVTLGTVTAVLAGCASAPQPRAPAALTVTFRNASVELCEGMHTVLLPITSWTHPTETAPTGQPSIAWRTLAPAIAEVSAEGEVTAMGPGRTVIEAEVLLGGRRGVGRAEINVKAGVLDAAATQDSDHPVCR